MAASSRKVVVMVALLAMIMSAGVDAFCFSFGNNDSNYVPYNHYMAPYPPPYPAYPSAGMLPPVVPGVAYSPVYPYPQPPPYGMPASPQPGW